MSPNLKNLVLQEFSGENSIKYFAKKVDEGLWVSERFYFEKYFNRKNTKVLDVGCGAGRTSIQLSKMGLEVTAIDMSPAMIYKAIEIAERRKLKIDYRIGDATALYFDDNLFDYAVFSNQGWTQIPDKNERSKALVEIKRVLKNKGIYIFSALPRVWSNEYFLFWMIQWIRFYLLKPLGFHVDEIDYGDRFFERESDDIRKTYINKQFIHIPTVVEVVREIRHAGFKILEVEKKMPISNSDKSSHPPVIYVCEA